MMRELRPFRRFRPYRRFRNYRDTAVPPLAHMAMQHFTTPERIACKWCGSTDTMKYGIRRGVQEYICNGCHRKFTARNTPKHMRFTVEQIGAALGMFYTGLSLADITRQMEDRNRNSPDPSTVYRWIMRYTKEVIATTGALRPRVSKVWVVDETVVAVNKHNLWLFDAIDERTRFLLGTSLVTNRTAGAAASFFRAVYDRTGATPDTILTDGLKSYFLGISAVYDRHETRHIVTKPFDADVNTNLIERFHGTLKERLKVMRGLKTQRTAQLILDGFVIDYNFFRPHMALGNATPAEVAGIDTGPQNWTDVVKASATK